MSDVKIENDTYDKINHNQYIRYFSAFVYGICRCNPGGKNILIRYCEMHLIDFFCFLVQNYTTIFFVLPFEVDQILLFINHFTFKI